MDLHKQSELAFAALLKSVGWKLGNHNASFIDVGNKTIWKACSDTLADLERIILFSDVHALKQSFSIINGIYCMNDEIKLLNDTINPGWKYDTVGKYLVLENKSSDDILVAHMSDDGFFSECSSTETHAIFATSKLANYKYIKSTSSDAFNVIPHIHANGVILYPNSLKRNNRVMRSTLIKDTDSEIICRIDDIYYEDNLRKVMSVSIEYYFTLVAGKIYTKINKMTPPTWSQKLKTEYDFFANPINKEVWEIINGEIKYESETLFVNDQDQTYINTSIGWLLVDKQWLNQDVNIPLSLKNEYNMVMAMFNLPQ